MGFSQIWKLIGILKSRSWDKLADFILPLIFENPVTKAWLMNHKREIGTLLTAFGLVLPVIIQSYPELAFLKLLNDHLILNSGVVLNLIGWAHAGSKERRDIPS